MSLKRNPETNFILWSKASYPKSDLEAYKWIVLCHLEYIVIKTGAYHAKLCVRWIGFYSVSS